MEFIKKYLVPIITVVLVIIGCIKINIYNTIALSPIGNTEDNFEKVSKEFGEDFSEFIKDNSPVKVYLGEEGDKTASVKVNEKEIKLTAENPFLKGIGPIINYFKAGISNVVDKFNKNTENNSDIQNDNENNIDLNNGEVETNNSNIEEDTNKKEESSVKEENSVEDTNSMDQTNTEKNSNTKENNSNEQNKNVQDNKSELDNIVDDFLNNQNQ